MEYQQFYFSMIRFIFKVNTQANWNIRQVFKGPKAVFIIEVLLNYCFSIDFRLFPMFPGFALVFRKGAPGKPQETK